MRDATNIALEVAIARSGKPKGVLAEKAAIELTRFSKLRRGAAHWTPEEKKRIARVLRMTVGELFAEPEAVAS